MEGGVDALAELGHLFMFFLMLIGVAVIASIAVVLIRYLATRVK